ncbi:hypothetical protein MYSTI_00518 [Myxococcus stipitatus DSM 14675]|uniref:AMIN-like domain-containing protein n=1 Tax=Myxococcus stipitatus (strain DSM 14675 / JCM 12634 / Mx s8) TaxID=1278073 RepID=L7U0Y5_MYXSD|nr:hypothetical protein [Myxococcus stipitatus]AGC41868.1 hypothetical protein MYSTI_00518 [Myxococcus stipitatus DSM 14675]
MKRAGRWLSSLWLAGYLGVAGCSKKEEAPPPPAAELPPAEEAPPSIPAPEGATPREGEAVAKPPVPVVPDGSTALPSSEAKEEPAPSKPPAPPGGGIAPEDAKNREWTTSPVELKRSSAPQATLRSVRAGAHPDFDRVVFEFEGTQLPGYRVEYPKEPVVQCGSGDVVSLAGKAQLQVSLMPARAHTDAGQPTVATREQKVALPVVVELERICDFEGEVSWALGTQGTAPFRIMELKEPPRLVVDVRH